MAKCESTKNPTLADESCASLGVVCFGVAPNYRQTRTLPGNCAGYLASPSGFSRIRVPKKVFKFFSRGTFRWADGPIQSCIFACVYVASQPQSLSLLLSDFIVTMTLLKEREEMCWRQYSVFAQDPRHLGYTLQEAQAHCRF